MNPYVKFDDVEWEELLPGFRRKIIGYQSDLMLIRVEFESGIEFPPHQHPHQQITHILEGRFMANIDGEKMELGPGDSYVVPGNVPHALKCINKGSAIDVFSPLREDFFEKQEKDY